MPKTTKPFVATYSNLSTFQTCPKQFYHLSWVKDVAYVQSIEAKEGDAVHKRFATAMEVGLDLPQSLKHYQWALDHVREYITYVGPGVYDNPKERIIVEHKMGLDSKLHPCGFFDDGVKFRGIVDIGVISGDKAYIADYKTGKHRPDTDQLDMMALLIFMHYPDVQSITGQLLFLKHPNELDEISSYSREDIPSLVKFLVHKMQAVAVAKKDDEWPAQKSGLCKNWCSVPRDLCEHSGRPPTNAKIR